MEEAAQKSSLCHSCHFLLPAFPSATRLRISLLSVSLKQDRDVPKSEIRGGERKEWKFLNIPEVIIGLKIVTFWMKGGKRRMRPVFLLGFIN